MYQLYLLDDAGESIAAASFLAEHDVAAKEIAAAVSGACSDIADAYELWRGGKCLTLTPSDWTLQVALLVLARQERALELEDTLQRSFACMKESKRLLTVTAQLRGKFAERP